MWLFYYTVFPDLLKETNQLKLNAFVNIVST